MKHWTTCISLVVLITCLAGESQAIVRYPTNSSEMYEVERAYRIRSEQSDTAPKTSPIPDADKRQQPDNIGNVMQAESVKNPQDVKNLLTVQQDIRNNNPWVRGLRVAGWSLLVLGICMFVLWQAWVRIAAVQRKRMLEQLHQGQQLAKELRDRL